MNETPNTINLAYSAINADFIPVQHEPSNRIVINNELQIVDETGGNSGGSGSNSGKKIKSLMLGLFLLSSQTDIESKIAQIPDAYKQVSELTIVGSTTDKHLEVIFEAFKNVKKLTIGNRFGGVIKPGNYIKALEKITNFSVVMFDNNTNVIHFMDYMPKLNSISIHNYNKSFGLFDLGVKIASRKINNISLSSVFESNLFMDGLYSQYLRSKFKIHTLEVHWFNQYPGIFPIGILENVSVFKSLHGFYPVILCNEIVKRNIEVHFSYSNCVNMPFALALNYMMGRANNAYAYIGSHILLDDETLKKRIKLIQDKSPCSLDLSVYCKEIRQVKIKIVLLIDDEKQVLNPASFKTIHKIHTDLIKKDYEALVWIYELAIVEFYKTDLSSRSVISAVNNYYTKMYTNAVAKVGGGIANVEKLLRHIHPISLLYSGDKQLEDYFTMVYSSRDSLGLKLKSFKSVCNLVYEPVKLEFESSELTRVVNTFINYMIISKEYHLADKIEKEFYYCMINYSLTFIYEVIVNSKNPILAKVAVNIELDMNPTSLIREIYGSMLSLFPKCNLATLVSKIHDRSIIVEDLIPTEKAAAPIIESIELIEPVAPVKAVKEVKVKVKKTVLKPSAESVVMLVAPVVESVAPVVESVPKMRAKTAAKHEAIVRSVIDCIIDKITATEPECKAEVLDAVQSAEPECKAESPKSESPKAEPKVAVKAEPKLESKLESKSEPKPVQTIVKTVAKSSMHVLKNDINSKLKPLLIQALKYPYLFNLIMGIGFSSAYNPDDVDSHKFICDLIVIDRNNLLMLEDRAKITTVLFNRAYYNCLSVKQLTILFEYGTSFTPVFDPRYRLDGCCDYGVIKYWNGRILNKAPYRIYNIDYNKLVHDVFTSHT